MKLNKLILPILSLFILSGCNDNKPIDSDSGNSSVNPLTSLSSEVPSSIEINDNTRYESESWDENVNALLRYSIGDAVSLIPTFESMSYVTYIDKYADYDMYGNSTFTTSTRMVCAPVDSTCTTVYGSALIQKGFVYDEDYDCYYTKITAAEFLYVYLKYNDLAKYDTMSMKIYKKAIREAEWDADIAYLLLGRDIPYIKCDAYEYYFEATEMALYVYFINVTQKQITDYKSELTQAGFVRKSVDAVSDVYQSNDEWISIIMSEGTDSFGDTYLLLLLQNSWPFFLIYSSTFGDLPKSNYGSYYGYTTDQLEDGTYYTQIEYDDVSYEQFLMYSQLMESREYGYELYPETSPNENPYSYESTYSGYGTIYVREYYKEIEKDTYAFVDVMYSKGLERLLIVIYG